MHAQDNDPLHAPISRKLAEIAAGLPERPPWLDEWIALGREPSEEARLAVYQAVRDSGCLPEEAGFYLVSWQIDAMACQEAEIRFRDLDDRMKAIEEAHGLEEGDGWRPGEAPREYEDLLQEYHAKWDGLYATTLEELGEPEMADLYRGDADAFRQKSELGRQFFHGPLDRETWVATLVEGVAECMTADSPMGSLGYRYGEEEGFWQIAVYPTPVELVGGASDGEIVAPGFTLDLEGLWALFDEVVDFTWESLGRPNDGPCVTIEGVYQGRDVWVQILAYAPEGEEPGMKLDTRSTGEQE